MKSGGVIAFPTDTYYGLGADPFNSNALARVFEIKKRSPDKPLLVLIHSVKQLSLFTDEVRDKARSLMDRFWPGPLTLLFKAMPTLPPELTAGSGKIGVRLPGYPFTLRFLEALDQPLTAPSANISGQSELRTAGEVAKSFGENLKWIVDGGPAPGGKVSTLLDCTTDPPSLVREGAVSVSHLECFFPIQKG